jgi:HEAT repeat-containing protein 5
MSTPKNTTDHKIARHLLPQLLSYITSDTEDPENAKGLVSHALSSFVSVVPSAQVPTAMGLFIPGFLARASQDKGVYRETASRLLELASTNQPAFRGVVGSLPQSQRVFMEEIIRAGSASKVEEKEAESAPAIALKMNFGAK